jgi:hypothetical protein
MDGCGGRFRRPAILSDAKDLGRPGATFGSRIHFSAACYSCPRERAAERFHPEAYEDEVKKRIQAQLKRKIETGEEISSAPSPESGEVIDLMEALRRSLGKQASGSGQRKSAAAPPAERRPARQAARGPAEKKTAARK